MNSKLKVFCALLGGIILGFVFSSIKQGIYVRVCNNRNNDRGET